MLTIEEITQQVSRIAPKFSIKQATLFGSYATGQQTEASDVDILVEFYTPSVSLLYLARLKAALEEALGLPVDIIHAPIPSTSFIAIGKTVPLYAA